MDLKIKEEICDYPESKVVLDIIKYEDVKVENFDSESDAAYSERSEDSFVNESYEVFQNEPDPRHSVHNLGEKQRNYQPAASPSNIISKRGKDFLCKLCKIFIHSEKWLSEHISMHQRNMFYCPEGCQFFYSQLELGLHMATHKSMWQLTCDVCKKTFTKKFGLKSHMSLHFPSGAHNCQVCKKGFRTKDLKTRHFNHCHNKNYECSVCKRLFFSKERVVKHMRLHNTIGDIITHSQSPGHKQGKKMNVFWCEICRVEIFSEEWYNEHKSKHENNTFNCFLCCEFFSNKTDLDGHISTHTPLLYECAVCDKTYKRKYLLKNHLTFHFPNELHVCHICKKGFRNSHILKNHLFNTHGKKYKCNICNLLLLTPAELKIHMSTHANAEDTVAHRLSMLSRRDDSLNLQNANRVGGENPGNPALEGSYYFWSASCEIDLRPNDNFQKHIERNTGFSLHCPRCSQNFDSELELEKHIASHYDINNFRFKVNLKGPKKSGKSRSNQNAGTNSDPNEPGSPKKRKCNFKCDICGESFRLKVAIQNHIFLHFPEEYLTCYVCDKMFKSTTPLKRHLREVHKLEKSDMWSETESGSSDKSSDSLLSESSILSLNESQSNADIHGKKDWERRNDHPKVFPNYIIFKATDDYLCKLCKIVIHSEKWLYTHILMHQRNMFYCPEGCQFFHSRLDLGLHMATHKSMWQLTCDVCKKTFTKKFGLKSHMTLHFPTGAHICHVCKKNFRTKGLRKKHFNQCHNKKYECSVCKRLFFLKCEVLRHMTLHNIAGDIITHKQNPVHTEGEKVNVFWCELCQLEIFSEEWYNEHKLKHERYNFHCLDCSEFFSNLSDLEVHFSKHTLTKFQCDVCEKTFREKYLLRNHLTIHFPFDLHICHICKKGYRNSYILKDHLFHVHGKKYKCYLCKILLPTPSELKKHMASHTSAEDTATLKLLRYDDSINTPEDLHKEAEEPKNLSINALEGSYYFWCSTCEIDLQSEEAFQKHTAKHKISLFQCPRCYQTFNSKPELETHISGHDDIYNFKCDLCLKTFNRKPRIRSHMYLHFPEEYLCCEPCNESFKNMSSFKKHTRQCSKFKELKRNASKKNVECPVCKKVFLWQYRLQYHMRTHEVEKEYLCLICLKAFEKPLGLKRHIKVCKSRNNQSVGYSGFNPDPEEESAKKRGWNYECDICKEHFRVKSAMQNHIYFHFPEEYLTCNICQKMLKTTTALKRHLREVHKLKILEQ